MLELQKTLAGAVRGDGYLAAATQRPNTDFAAADLEPGATGVSHSCETPPS